MRLIKSNKIAYLQRSYGVGEQYYYVASPILFFDLLTGEIQTENIQWGKIAKVLGSEVLDHGLPKTTGEFLLAGTAYAEKENLQKITVSAQVANNIKTLNVFGQRAWRRSWLGGFVATEAQNITHAPITHENTYGGAEYKLNPLGTGSDVNTLLPQIEHPQYPVKDPKTKASSLIKSASFMPLSITWPQRAKYHGKYKGDWFDKYFPAMPVNTDLRLLNMAPQDQQLTSYFNGDEFYCLQNLHPEHTELVGQLPQVKARAFINTKQSLQDRQKQQSLQELPLVLDTLWLMPDIMLGAIIFRGQIPVNNMESLEVTDVMLAYENLQDTPKPVSHYENVFSLRTDPKTALASVMNEGQLSPLVSEQDKTSKAQKVEVQKQKKVANIRKRQQLILDGFSSEIPLSVDQLPEPELTPMDELLEEDVKSGNFDLTPVLAYADKKITEANDNAEKTLTELRKKFSIPDKPEPKVFNAENANENLTLTFAPDSLELQSLLAKQMSIQADDELAVSDEAAQLQREWLKNNATPDSTLNGKDFTGADLSNLTFTEVDFSQSVFSFANLENTQFINCRFTESAFSNATLTDCIFEQCDLSKTSFFGITAQRPHFLQCNLTSSLWRSASAISTTFVDCDLTHLLFLMCELTHSRFHQCQMNTTTVTQGKLNDCDFIGCDLQSCIFSETHLQMSRWHQCKLTRCVMQLCPMQLASFYQIQSHKLVFSNGTILTRSNWFESTCDTTSFRSVTAVKAYIENCHFSSCDYSEAVFVSSQFIQTKLTRCVAAKTDFAHSLFEQCNCYRSRFRSARFDYALLHKCNFLEADLMWAEFQNTQLKQCINLSKVAERDQKRIKQNNKVNDNDQERIIQTA